MKRPDLEEGVAGVVRVEVGRIEGHRNVFSFSTSLKTFMTKINDLPAFAVWNFLSLILVLSATIT